MTGEGQIQGVNGNLIAVAFEGGVRQNEVGYAILGDRRLKAEVIRITGRVAEMQVFDDTRGLGVGDKVAFTGELLSVELGPGLLGQVFDGLQNPLATLADIHGIFLPRGAEVEPLDRQKEWTFEPIARPGQPIRAGEPIGRTKEGIFDHLILAPFDLRGDWHLDGIVDAGPYRVGETIATLRNTLGKERSLGLSFTWPAKLPVHTAATSF